MDKKYFGTDGIRGRVGQEPMTAPFILKLGWAAGKVLGKQCNRKRRMILIGKDTRNSGYLFESALEAGLSSAGVDSLMLGPMPTPGIAYLTRTFRATAGIVISASHNPFYDNGVKFFSGEGTKLPDELELEIESMLDSKLETVDSAELGRAKRVNDAGGRYIEFCKSTFPLGQRLNGLNIIVDAAHGAAYDIAKRVFIELGGRVTSIGDEPDGLNINRECGATSPAFLASKVLELKADIGIALDGDGDRVIMVDHRGEVVDGDELLFMIAKARQSQNQLQGGGVVGTVMSNLGLELEFKAMGIPFARAKVGDRFVLEKMHKEGWILGGESSGHIICLDRTTTGDGIVSALQVLAYMTQTEKSLQELKSGMNRFPQTLVNVPMARRVPLNQVSAIKEAVSAAEQELAEDGRVLLRPSGTEPLVRVMVEGRNADDVKRIAQQLAEVVGEALKAA